MQQNETHTDFLVLSLGPCNEDKTPQRSQHANYNSHNEVPA